MSSQAVQCARERHTLGAVVYGAWSGGALTLSIGVAEVDPERDGKTPDWVERADAALYRAKSGGRNRVVSTPGTSQS